jgi:inosine-uridine nucleoside N-ribohydrolase
MQWSGPAVGLATTGVALTVAVTMHLTGSPTTSSQPAETERFIVDVDHAMDDTFALALALRSPELRIIGITLVPHPEAAQQARFVARMLHELGQDNLPLALGTRALTNSCRCGHWATISHTLGVDYPAPISESAAKFIVRQANATPDRPVVVTPSNCGRR